jgi:acetyl-CoA C-acetyltransferase
MHAMIFDAVRTPRGKGKASGSLYTTKPIDLLAGLLTGLRDRNGLDTTEVDDVVVGCVTQTGDQGACIARFAALKAWEGNSVPGVTLNRFCASGLEAVNHAAAMVASGFHDVVVAGGVESMSRVPMGSDGGAIFDPDVLFDVGSVPQGISADLIATLDGFSREDVDTFALQSQEKAAAAMADDRFARSILAVRDASGLPVLATDEFPRPGTTLDGLGKLNPSFEAFGVQFGLDALVRQKYPTVDRVRHVHHAGNSSGIVDGAAAVLLATEEKGRAMGLTPRARIRSVALTAEEPIIMLTGPVSATQKALAKAGMTIADIDLFECNEAFAAVPLHWMRELSVDPDKVNVNGGSIAFGHPLGATGAMLLNTLVDELERRDLNTGLVTLCVGGGMGIATIVERV